MIIEKLNKTFDTVKALREAEFLLERYGNGSNQLCLSHRAGVIDEQEKFFDGIGSLYDYNTNTPKADEADFCVFNSSLTHTYMYEIYKQFTKPGRFRIMRIKPITCYSVHKDKNPRLHIVLKTNPDAYFIFPDDNEVFRIPLDGYAYRVDTRKSHTYINGSRSEDRIHLVIDDLSGKNMGELETPENVTSLDKYKRSK
jgi:hypothetical protein